MSGYQIKLLGLLTDGQIWYVSSHVERAVAAALASLACREGEVSSLTASLEAERAAHRRAAAELDAFRAVFAAAREVFARAH